MEDFAHINIYMCQGCWNAEPGNFGYLLLGCAALVGEASRNVGLPRSYVPRMWRDVDVARFVAYMYYYGSQSQVHGMVPPSLLGKPIRQAEFCVMSTLGRWMQKGEGRKKKEARRVKKSAR